MWNTAGDELRRAYGGHQSMVTSISPSSNDNVFLTGSTDKTIRIWSLLNHKATGIPDFKYENTSVISVRPNSSSARAGVRVGDRIVSIDGHSLDDIYKLMLYDQFDCKPGQTVPVVMRRGDQQYEYSMKLVDGFDYVEPLLNVFIGDNDQWVIWTPLGYYDASPGADQLIGWHVNQGPKKAEKFYRAQQFRNQLYRPDIINRIIETGIVATAEQVANRDHAQNPPPLDLRDQTTFAAHRPPVVTILSPQSGKSYNDPRVVVKAQVSVVNDLPITRVTLLHNGMPARVFRSAGKDESANLNISHRVRLFPGRNEITFVAENRTAISAAEDSRVTLLTAAAERKSKVYVLAIGVAEYAKNGMGVDNLKFAAADARAFARAVHNHSHGQLYSSIEPKVLVNEQAGRSSILEGLQWLVDNVQQGDVVMLFCWGHGFLDQRGNFYLGSHEVDPKNLRSTGTGAVCRDRCRPGIVPFRD